MAQDSEVEQTEGDHLNFKDALPNVTEQYFKKLVLLWLTPGPALT